jgi:hypothetical protein
MAPNLEGWPGRQLDRRWGCFVGGTAGGGGAARRGGGGWRPGRASGGGKWRTAKRVDTRQHGGEGVDDVGAGCRRQAEGRAARAPPTWAVVAAGARNGGFRKGEVVRQEWEVGGAARRRGRLPAAGGGGGWWGGGGALLR